MQATEDPETEVVTNKGCLRRATVHSIGIANAFVFTATCYCFRIESPQIHRCKRSPSGVGNDDTGHNLMPGVIFEQHKTIIGMNTLYWDIATCMDSLA